MKKMLFTVLGIILFSCYGFSQVIADFEASENGFTYGWGACLSGSTVQRVADPTSQSSGVLQLAFDASGSDQKGAIGADVSKLDVSKAVLVTYYIYLPKGTPDSLMIKVWAQDNAWNWQDFKLFAVNVPKEKWYPVHFNLDMVLATSTFIKDKPMQKTGLEIGTYNLKGADLTWKGNILVDNVSLVGVKPLLISSFDASEDGYFIGWGDFAVSLGKIADPLNSTNGVLGVNLKISGSKDKKTGIGKDVSKMELKDQHVVVQYFYLPSDTPDSLLIKFWAQDNAWTWIDFKYYAKDLPKGKWFPIIFDLEATKLANSSFVIDKPLQKIGAEIDCSAFGLGSSTWTGTVCLDNVAFLGSKVELKWLLVDFEAVAGGTFNFSVQAWGPGAVSVQNVVDPTNSANRVLQEALEMSASPKNKAVIKKDGLSLMTTKPDTAYATAISLDVYIPSDMPKGAQVSIFGSGSALVDGWAAKDYFIDDSAFVAGAWHTLTLSFDQLIKDAKIDRTKPLDMGVQIYYATAPTWSGKVYYDNLTLYGIEKPTSGALSSPKVVAEVDTATYALSKFEFVKVQWIDNEAGTEVYNVYFSKNPITNTKADGVIKLASGVPHGIQQWGHRPWEISGASQTYYYAVTASPDNIEETPIIAQCQAGPFTLKASVPAKVQYVKDFASKFTLDGLDKEWSAYKVNQITPDAAGGDRGPAWTKNSTDINFKITYVIDDKYLYFSGDVTDDDLRNDTLMQSWEGDALEMYMGFYDAAKLKEYHPKGLDRTIGDWRIGFTDLGTVTLDGGVGTNVPGVEAAVFQKITGDGYILEGRITLDSMAQGGKFTVYNNMMLPLRVDGNDMDPKKGETARGGIVQWGGWSSKAVGMDEDWKRASTFGMMQVINGPDAVENTTSMLPKEYRLYNNYPNPFNPSTVIKYDLKENGRVLLKVYDILGREVTTLVNTVQKAGSYNVFFNARSLATGVYIYKLQAGNFEKSMKMLLIK